jgi:hypothetical protein
MKGGYTTPADDERRAQKCPETVLLFFCLIIFDTAAPRTKLKGV